MKLIVTGSVAFDYLMSFPGKFTEHFLPEHMHRVSLSFLVDSMDKRRGGCAPNIAYTLALLGQTPFLMATAGQDFGDYRAWLGRLAEGATTDKHAVADHVFTLYGLVARFNAVLEFATDATWKLQKEKLPADLDDDEQIAIETGIANGLRSRLFIEVEQATLTFALPRLLAGDDVTRRALTTAIDKLEHNVRLLRLNLNEAAALEDFLLASLRIWSRRS